VLGVGFGTAGPVVGVELAGWPPNGWRYFGLAVAALVGLTAPAFGAQMLFWFRLGWLILVALTVLAVLAVLVARLFGMPFRTAFGVAVTLMPLLYLGWFAVVRPVRDDRIRAPRVAALAGALGPWAAAGVAYLLAGMADGPHRLVYLLGPVVGAVVAVLAARQAGLPYCDQCRAWLDERRIGAFARSRPEMEALLRDGALVQLAAEPVHVKAEKGEVELRAFSCPDCGPRGPVVLELHECQPSKNTTVLVRVGRWVYPGAAVAVLERLFPPPADDPAPVDPA
jgi:hypothetical protein